jgi:branched-chain amino acid transport system substrate-binding protein
MRKTIRTARVLILAGAFLMPPGVSMAAEPIKIGVLVPLTGIVALGGLEMKYGKEMAANEKGTILGRPVELVVEDTQIKPDVAVSKTEKFVL